MEGKRQQVSTCFLDLLALLAIELRQDPSAKVHLDSIGRVASTLRGAQGKTWFTGTRQEAGLFWDSYLCSALNIKDVADSPIAQRSFCYPLSVPVPLEDLEVLCLLLENGTKVGADEADLREYADLIHALPEILAHGNIDRKAFWKGFVRPYVSKYPEDFSPAAIRAFKSWSGSWF